MTLPLGWREKGTETDALVVVMVLVVVIVVWLFFVHRSNSELRSENIQCGPISRVCIHLNLILDHCISCFPKLCSKLPTTIIYC